MHPVANPEFSAALDLLEDEPDEGEPERATLAQLQEEHRQEHEAKRRAAHAEIDRTFDEVWARATAQMEAIFRELDGQRPS